MPAPRIVIIAGDLVEQDVDAIVNAANNDLVLGGGRCGRDPESRRTVDPAECDAHGPVRVGEAAITGAGELPARHVIHAASMALGGAHHRSVTAVVDGPCISTRARASCADHRHSRGRHRHRGVSNG